MTEVVTPFALWDSCLRSARDAVPYSERSGANCPRHLGPERFISQSGHTGLPRKEVRPCVCLTNWKFSNPIRMKNENSRIVPFLSLHPEYDLECNSHAFSARMAQFQNIYE